jgi:anti-sigma factor RsiW
MTPCSKADDPDWVLMIQSSFDGELDAIHSLQVETHLATCPSCAGQIDRLRAMKETIGRKDVSWRAPTHVRAQVMEALVQAADRREPQRAVEEKGPSASVAAIIRQWLFVPSLAVLAASLFLVFGPLQIRSSLEDEIVASHIRSTLVNHLTDVQTSDRHTVKPWFNGKIDFAPPVADLAAQGFPLVGGRVDYVGGRVVAALVYRRHGHVINLFVWPSSGPVARSTARDGYTLESWTSNGLTFVAVSDTGADDMNAFRLAFLAQTDIVRSGE